MPTIQVTTIDDSGDNLTGGASENADLLDGGGMSLREAIAWAGSPGAIQFSPSLANQTIMLGSDLTIDPNVTIRIGSVDNLTISGAKLVAQDLFLDTSPNVVSTVQSDIQAAGNVFAHGGGTLVLSGMNTWSGVLDVKDTIVSIGTGLDLGAGDVVLFGGTLAVAGATVIANDFSLIGQGVVDNSNAVTLAGVIGGPGAFIKAGAGTVILSGSNVYDQTLISAGVLRIGTDANLGTGAVDIAAGATLHVHTDGSNVTIDNDITGAGTLLKTTFGHLTLTGANAGSSVSLEVTGGTLRANTAAELGDGDVVLSGSAGIVLGSGAFSNNISLAGDGFIGLASAGVTLDGVISGTGALTKVDLGILTLSGANTFSGGLVIDAGVVAISDDAALGTGTLTLQGNARLNVTSDLELANAVSVTGPGVIQVSTGVTATLTGALSGSAGLQKMGAGTLVLEGASTYTGALSAIAGELVLDTNLTSAITVFLNGRLSGDGGTNRSVTVQSGGRLIADSLSTGAVTLNAGANFVTELGGAAPAQYGALTVTGTVSLAGANLNLTLAGGYTPTNGTVFRIIDNDSADAITGTFNGLAEGAVVTVGAAKFTLSYIGGTGNDVTLTYVAPPPPVTPPAPEGPSSGDDVLSLPGSGGTLSAGAGNDQVSGQGGADWIHGNGGADSLLGGAGTDTMMGGQGDDALGGGDGNDLLFADLGSDSVDGGAGNDVIWGGGGAIADQPDGADTLLGGAGDDYVNANAGQDQIEGGEGLDYLQGGRGADTVLGNQGQDSLYGDKDDDVLAGGKDADQISGGDGADVLYGDLGADTLTGGAGADLFGFRGADGADLITDFSYAAGDRLHLDADLAGAKWTAATTPGGALITFETGGSITLAGVDPATVTQGWFA